jgi:6-phosphogluconolactonase (cycloisomerase 2 family)
VLNGEAGPISSSNPNGPTAIAGFDVNSDTGALTPMAGSPFSAPDQSMGLVATGGFLYTAGGVPGTTTNLVSYQIGPTGALTQAGSTPIAHPVRYELYAHSSGKFIYTIDNMGDVLGFQITAPGQTVPISGTPQSLNATDLALTPDGKWGIVSYWQTSNGGAHLYVYSINSSTGAWSGPVGDTPGVGGNASTAGRNPTDVHLAVDPSSSFLFAANPSENLVFAFHIGSDGSLTAVGNPNGTMTPGNWPVAIAATGAVAYIGDWNGALLSGYSFTSGTLTPTPGSPYADDGANARDIAVAPGQHLLYVVNNSGVVVFNIAADGSLSQISGSPFTDTQGQNPLFIALH